MPPKKIDAAKAAVINLLPEEFKKPGRKQRLKELAASGSLLILLLYGLVLLVLFSTLIFYRQKLNNLETLQAQLTEDVKSLGDVEALFVTLKDRATLGKKALSASIAPLDRVSDVLGLMGREVRLLELETQESKVKFTAEAANSRILSEYWGALKTRGYRRLTLTTFGKASGSKYIFQVEVE